MCCVNYRFDVSPEQEAMCYKLNCEVPVMLYHLAEEIGAETVYASTSMVFSGREDLYTVDDAVCPLTAYGRSKAEAEKVLVGNALVIRFGLMYGFDQGNFLMYFYNTLKRGKPLEAYQDEYRAPIYVDEAVQILISLIEQNVPKDKVYLHHN